MDKDYYVKYGAQEGDIFILLKQSVTCDVPEALVALQRQYGGIIRFPFHVTCQRFVCSGEQLSEVVKELEPYLQSIQPFTISLDAVESLYSEFFQCEVLKARAYPTAPIEELFQDIDLLLEKRNLEIFYKTPSIWLTVLENIDKVVPETKIETARSILNIDLVIIDQLQADKSFKQIKEISLF